MKIPIVFIHTGFQEYIVTAIKQAKSYNDARDVILIGDDSNDKLKNIVKHYHLEKYSCSAEELGKHFKNFSTNSFDYEFFCFKRWFILLDFMRERQMEWVFAADTDVMIYADVNSFFSRFIETTGHQAAFCFPQQQHDDMRWVASAHTSYISYSFLKNFCQFVLEVYKSNIEVLLPKIKHHQENEITGGVNDMTFFYLYLREINGRYVNLLENIGGRIFNVNVGINTTEHEIGIDTIKWHKNMITGKKEPCSIAASCSMVYFDTLHLHGGSKFYMQRYYTGYWDREIIKREVKRLLKRIIG